MNAEPIGRLLLGAEETAMQATPNVAVMSLALLLALGLIGTAVAVALRRGGSRAAVAFADILAIAGGVAAALLVAGVPVASPGVLVLTVVLGAVAGGVSLVLRKGGSGAALAAVVAGGVGVVLLFGLLSVGVHAARIPPTAAAPPTVPRLIVAEAMPFPPSPFVAVPSPDSAVLPGPIPVGVAGPVEAPRGPAERSATTSLSADLPEWVTAGTVREEDRTLVVLSGQQFAAPEAARQDALAQARDLIQWDFDAGLGHIQPPPLPTQGRTTSGTSGRWGSRTRQIDGNDGPGLLDYASDRWALEPATAASAAVRRTHTEAIERTVGDHRFTVYRTHLLVELSPAVRAQVEPIWREQAARGRSALVGLLFAAATGVVGLAAAFFRFKDRAQGRDRGRLTPGAVGGALLAFAVGIVTLA